MKFQRRTCLTMMAFAGACAISSPLLAQGGDWTAKPITLVIPYPPGGSADLLGRPLATQLQKQLGQSIVLEYKPGAGGMLASQFVANAKPDGHTLLMVLAAHAINPSIYPKLPYDTRKDFTPISLAANLPMIVVGSPKLKARDIKELVAAAKAAPEQLTFGSAGNGNTGHLAGEYFSSATGVKMTHVPYKGSANVVTAMLAGDIDLTFDSISTSIPHVRSGKLHALAVTSTQRSPLAPEIPTVQEQGVTGFEVNGWYAIMGPAGVPDTLAQRISGEIAKALKEPALQEQLSKGGYETVGSTPQQLQQHIDREIKTWSKVVADSGAKVD